MSFDWKEVHLYLSAFKCVSVNITVLQVATFRWNLLASDLVVEEYVWRLFSAQMHCSI
jgi:hypothetical protein